VAVNTESGGAVDISIDVAARMRPRGISVNGLTEAGQEIIWTILDGLAWQLGEFIDLVWPVDTGASQADWETTAEGFEWVIRNPREYAAYVHRAGTSPDDEVYKQVAKESERLLSGAWPQIKAAAERSRRSKTSPGLLAEFQKLLLPSAAGAAGLESGGTIFAAQVRAFERVNTRSRERARARAR
jgi:hypothetical protein